MIGHQTLILILLQEIRIENLIQLYKKERRIDENMNYIKIRGIGCKNVVVMALLVIATALPEKVTNLNI